MSTLLYSFDIILADFCTFGFLYARSIKIRGSFCILFVDLFIIALAFWVKISENNSNYLCAQSILSFITLILTVFGNIYIVNYRKNKLSQASIREAFDLADVGVCYFTETGRVILCNSKMNEVSRNIQGTNVLNGFEFKNIILNNSVDSVVKDDKGRVLKFSFGKISVGDEKYNEITAADITDFSEKNDVLLKENARIDKMNESIREYGAIMDDLIREREVLNAKIRIHDSFGDLLLSTTSVINENRLENVPQLITKWTDSLSFLSVKENKTESLNELINAAKRINVDIIINGEMPENGAAEEIFLLSIRECLTNAVKYADSHNLYVNIEKQAERNLLFIENDGNPPEKEIHEGGGLSMLRNKVIMAGGIMDVISLPSFRLNIEIPLAKENYRENV